MDDSIADNARSSRAQSIDGASMDIVGRARRELLTLFPDVETDGGQIDFDALKRSLGEAIDSGRERYGLSWPGKADCFKVIQTPSMATLLPAVDESVEFESAQHVFIEGDNLEVLKVLQKGYLGTVDLIYIDPPYNTGNDFIYPDDYSESLRTYLAYTGQIDAEGKKFGTNSDVGGRFHSRWLNMIYPRLYLARNMLREAGLIFVSIDDGEVSNLRLVMDEIFGQENFVSCIVWKKTYGGGAKVKHVVGLHEYVLVYCRNKDALGVLELPADAESLKYYKQRDSKFDLRGPYRTQPLATTSMDERPNLRFPIPWQGHEIWPEKQWQWSRDRVYQALANDELVVQQTAGKWSVRYKQYLKDEHGTVRGAKPFSVLEGPYTQSGTAEIRDIFGDNKIFEFPKPSALIKHFLQYLGTDAAVLDFFAGSASTAQAVLELNREDGGTRTFVLVQLPEKTNHPEFATIADISKARVRHVIKAIEAAANDQMALTDDKPANSGFRVFTLAESNIKAWDSSIPHDADALATQMSLHIDHLRHDRTDLDVLYEVILKEGFSLSSKVAIEIICGRTVYSVAGGAFLICLDRLLDLELLRAIAERKPERVLLLDEGFAGNDQLKTNASQTFKGKNIVLKTL